MDIDLEIGSDEGNSPEPIFHSILNAMGSKKEATAHQIYKRIQQEGMTNYSKPQVDRALANALQYGIFEVRNNRYRMRDDILDDDDTIYCQAQIKREKTPFRLENNQRDYINPEKDQHTFRRLYVSDGEERISSINQTQTMEISKRRKRRMSNQTTMNSASRKSRFMKNCDDQQMLKSKIMKTKFIKMERNSIQSNGTQPKRMRGPEEQRKVKRKKKWNYNIVKGKYLMDHNQYSQTDESDSSTKFNRRMKRKRKTTCQSNNRNENEEQDDNNKYDEKNEVQDEFKEEDKEQEAQNRTEMTSIIHKNKNRIPHSSYFEYMKEPYASRFSSNKIMLYEYDDFNLQGKGSDITRLPNEKIFENRYWNSTLLCSKWNIGRSENNQVPTLSGNADWLINRPENMQNGTVKQFNNALKIEPLDSLPSENMEEPSYIS